MNILVVILIILVCLVLSFFVLIQNPKGGGLSGSFGGFGGQVMGVKKSTDAVEKMTWYSILALVVIILASYFMTPTVVKSGEVTEDGKTKIGGNISAPPTAPPAQSVPAGQNPQPQPLQGGQTAPAAGPTPTPPTR